MVTTSSETANPDRNYLHLSRFFTALFSSTTTITISQLTIDIMFEPVYIICFLFGLTIYIQFSSQ